VKIREIWHMYIHIYIYQQVCTCVLATKMVHTKHITEAPARGVLCTRMSHIQQASSLNVSFTYTHLHRHTNRIVMESRTYSRYHHSMFTLYAYLFTHAHDKVMECDTFNEHHQWMLVLHRMLCILA
jgi:hypothetical protein